MFLTLEEFLNYFPPLDISKEDFRHHFKVQYKVPMSLAELFTPPNRIVKSENDPRYQRREQITEYFYEIIVRNRYKYLALWYDAYFNFKDPNRLKWNGIDLTRSDYPEFISTQRNDASRRIIRNLFHIELLDKTVVTNSVKSRVSFWRGLVNMYNKLELEDRLFAPSCIALFLRDKRSKRAQETGEINYNNLFYMYQAYQPKASIFNPYSIKYIFDMLTRRISGGNSDGLKLFSPVLSWGSYMLAYIFSPQFSYYLGVDVMQSVCEKTKFLADTYLESPYRKAEVVCCPSEKLADRYPQLVGRHRETFDLAIVCPPYYDMEIYHEGEQSLQWGDYPSWLEGYWHNTVQLMYLLLKRGGRVALIANDYRSLKGESYDLTGDLTAIMDRYFTYECRYLLHNRTSPLRSNKKDRTERLFIYRKGDTA